jgi:hypothetical protein
MAPRRLQQSFSRPPEFKKSKNFQTAKFEQALESASVFFSYYARGAGDEMLPPILPSTHGIT